MAAFSNTVTLPEDLAAEARVSAEREGRPLESLVAVAVSRYLRDKDRLTEMLSEGQRYGRQIGITSEDDVTRIANGEISIDSLSRKP